MAEIDKAFPAFPHASYDSFGMTLRDYFAGQALCGWYTNAGSLPAVEHLAACARHFYAMADAMLAEREK